MVRVQSGVVYAESLMLVLMAIKMSEFMWSAYTWNQLSLGDVDYVVRAPQSS